MSDGPVADNMGIALGGGGGTTLLFLRGCTLSLLRRLTPFPISGLSPSDGWRLEADLDFEILGNAPEIDLDFDLD